MKTVLRPSETGSFFADALRDLIVVVVGILAALWLESWWQDRQDRSEETLLLNGLRGELVANREQLVDKMANWSTGAAAANRAHQLMSQPEDAIAISELAKAFDDATTMRFFDPQQGQLSSLINSGKLGLVHNAELRAKIANWPGLVADMEMERNIAFFDITVGLRSYLSAYRSNWGSTLYEDSTRILLLDRKIDARLGGLAGNLSRMLGEGALILQATDEIIASIDDELAN